MKLLRNSYREILILFYFSLVTFLPVVAVVRIVHGLTNFSLLVEKALLLLAILLGTFLSLIGVLIFYLFLSAVLQTKTSKIHEKFHEKIHSVESFYR